MSAIGELVGALAVVTTLIYLAVQVRHSKSAVDENTRIARIAAVDQHTQAQSMWRGRLAENRDLAAIWFAARGGLDALDQVAQIQFTECARDFFNVWRSSYAAALSVQHEGQMKQIAHSGALTLHTNAGVLQIWQRRGRRLSEMVVPEFVEAMEAELFEMQQLEQIECPDHDPEECGDEGARSS